MVTAWEAEQELRRWQMALHLFVGVEGSSWRQPSKAEKLDDYLYEQVHLAERRWWAAYLDEVGQR